jgi:hypothetical protein
VSELLILPHSSSLPGLVRSSLRGGPLAELGLDREVPNGSKTTGLWEMKNSGIASLRMLGSGRCGSLVTAAG